MPANTGCKKMIGKTFFLFRSNMDLSKLPKFLLYKIANYLPFTELEHLLYLNKYYYQRLCCADEYWQSRLLSYFGERPADFPTCNFKKYYAEIANTLYRLDDNSGLSGRLIGSNAKSVTCHENFVAIIKSDSCLCLRGESDKFVPNVKKIECTEDAIYILTNSGSLRRYNSTDFSYLNDITLSETTDFTVSFPYIFYRRDDHLSETVMILTHIQQGWGPATATDYKIKKFVGVNSFGESVVYISNDNRLHLHKWIELGNDKYIADNVRAVYAINSDIYWIDFNNILYHMKYDTSSSKTQLFKNVKKIALASEYLLILTWASDLYLLGQNFLRYPIVTEFYVGQVECCFRNCRCPKQFEEPQFIGSGIFDVSCCDDYAIITKVI